MEVAYSDTLQHYGVQGMKWGVWNAETRARRFGGGSKQRRADLMSKARKSMDKIVKSDQYNIAANALNISQTALVGKSVAQALLGKETIASLTITGISVMSDPVLAGAGLATGLLIGVGGIGVSKIKARRIGKVIAGRKE